MLRYVRFLVVVVPLGLAGCSTHSGEPNPTATSTGVVMTERVGEIVKHELTAIGWVRYKVDYARYSGGVWNVHVTKLPPIHGGHCILDIADDGTVKRHPGM